MKDLAKKALLGSGLLRLAASFQRRGAAILMYHSVLEEPSDQADSLGGIIHSRDGLSPADGIARARIPSLGHGRAGDTSSPEEKIPERSVVVTFDDGYRDNFENAMPILDQFGVRCDFLCHSELY